MKPVLQLEKMQLSGNQPLVDKIWDRVQKNDGYCPCSSLRDKDHICPCKEAREQGICHCGLYVKK